MSEADDNDFIKELGEILEACGARVTFDKERSTALPCISCGTKASQRFLRVVGHWIRDQGNTLIGDPVARPLCASCAHEIGLAP